MVWKTVVTHRLKKLKYLRALEKLAAWRSHGFDGCDVYDGQWFHSRLPPTPEETTASMWADVNALKKEISMSEKERSEQSIENFLNEIEGCADKELARFERFIMERKRRAAAPAFAAPTGTALAQPSNPRPRCSGISFDVCVCMEESTKGKIEPELGELECLEPPGQ